jgi:transposase
MIINDESWEFLSPIFEVYEEVGIYRKSKAGAPRKWSMRLILEACFFVQHTGIAWQDLPIGYPPKTTAHRWFQRFCKDGLFEKAFKILVDRGESSRKIKMKIGAVDGTFIRAKKGVKKLRKAVK